MNIVVLGYGQYGKALGSLLAHNKVAFTPVDIDMPLAHQADLVIQTVPTQFMRQALATHAHFIKPDVIIINAAKGIEKDTHQLPHEILQAMGYQNYHSLIGPSFATGIIQKDPTLVSLGGVTEHYIETIKRLLQTPYFRIQAVADYRAIELAGAMKNVYAIACGYADGMGLGANTRAKLITLALQEMVKLGGAAGFAVDALASGVVGDLVLTASSIESRNYQFGKNLATMSAAEALQCVGPTVEGYHTSQSIQALSQKYTVELPLASLVHKLIQKGTAGHRLFRNFVKTI